MKKTIDLTEGNIWKKTLAFALPLLGTSFIQQLYNTVDLLFVGNMLDSRAQAAVGASSLLVTCVVVFFTGLSVGCGVVASQARGAKDKEKLDRIFHTALGLSLAGGAALSIAGFLLAGAFLRWINTPQEIFAAGVMYARIYLFSMIPLCIFNIYAGIMRALGDSKTPMLIQLAGGITNVAADYILIRLMPDGVNGVALATLFSQGVGAWLCIRYMQKGNEWGRLTLHRISLHTETAAEILRMGVPAGLQNLVIALSNVFVQSKVNQLGVEAIAGYSVYFKVELLNYMPIVSIGSAAMTLSGQCYGAGNNERIRQGVRICIAMGIVYVLCMSAFILRFGASVFAIFNRDPAVIASGMRIVHVTFWLYWLYVILQVLADTCRGKGKSLQPMLIILATICVFRTICLMIFTRNGISIERVAATYPAAWAAAVIGLLVYWIRERKRIKE